MPTKREVLDQINFRSYYESELGNLGSAGADGWTKNSKCPFHVEKNGSFGININDGRFKCFGCDAQGSIFDFHIKKHGVDFETTKQQLADFAGVQPVNNSKKFHHFKLGYPVKKYPYHDHDSRVLYFVCRFNPKEFRPCNPDGKWKVKGIKPVPYNLPAMTKAETVFLAEGEKDADTINSLGLIGTCKANWTGKFNKDFAKYFERKTVYILQDADQAGADKAQDAARALSRVDGVKIKVLPPFDLKKGYDVTDFFNDGHTKAELLKIVGNTEFSSPLVEMTVIDGDAIKKRVAEILDSQQPCKTFDIDKLPYLISRYAGELCEQTAAEPIMIVQSILCTISAIIGRNICIPETEYFQRLYPNIWCCTLSKSGSFKTTALNKGAAMAYKMLEKTQRRVDLLINSAINSKEEKKAIEKQIRELEKQSPIFSSRATAEAFTDELSTGQAGQIIASELGAWLKNMNAAHAGSIKQLLTDFYDTPNFYSYRTRTGGALTVKEPFVTINGVSTVQWIQQNLEAEDVSSGFFARFLLFYPPQKNVIPAALPLIKKTSGLMAVINDITDILEETQRITMPLEYRLNNEAKELFNAYHAALYETLFDESEKAQQILEPFVKRWSPYLLKIAMIMQAIDKPLTNVLTTSSLMAAKNIIDYAVKSTTYLFKHELGETEHQKKCRKVLEYLAKRKGQCRWSQLLSSHTLTGGTKDYDYICQTLSESGQIQIDTSPGKKQDHKIILKTGV